MSYMLRHYLLQGESKLRNQFLAAAKAMDGLTSQIVCEFMPELTQHQRETREHDAWFRSEIEQALREADDPAVTRIPDEDVRSKWRQQRAELVKRGGGNGA